MLMIAPRIGGSVQFLGALLPNNERKVAVAEHSCPHEDRGNFSL